MRITSKTFNVFTGIILSCMLFSNLFSQVTTGSEEDKNSDYVLPGNREDLPAFMKKAQEAQGWLKYVRPVVHDGNLIETGLVNQGQISHGYFSGGSVDLIWPKGSGTEYGHNFVFFVAAEVIDVNGDTIHIVSDRFNRQSSEQSVDGTHNYHFMPLPKYYNNRQPGSLDWDIGGISEDVGIDGIPFTGDEGEGDGILQVQEDFNRNGRLDLSMLNEVEWFAISSRRETWPEYWPAGSYPGDDRSEGEERPGPRSGRWNGEYGAYVRADQESYYLMDDHENDEFDYFPFEDSLSMRPWPEGRRGLGVTVEVRTYQWAARLAEDILISIYDVTNYGKPLDKAVVGMVNDPDLGGSLSGDNASFDEIDDITYAWNEAGISDQGLPTGYLGYAFLESPGLAFDGIDNDQDGMIDESQYNNIDDDGDWRSWEDLNGNGVWDTEDTNFNGILDEGEDLDNDGRLDWEPLGDDLGSDGIGPAMEGYSGPDSDGSEANGVPDRGEPNYEFTDNDESDQVGLTSFYLRDVDNAPANDEYFWNNEIQPGTFYVRPNYTRDIAWVYGSGFIDLIPGEDGTQRYAIALAFGNDENDIIRNKRTIQAIYDADYNFTKPPRKPILTAKPSDGQVLLLWDDAAERSRDPVYGNDFEAYMIYKSTDPNFSDIKTITDAFGNPILFEPLVMYDLNNGLKGPHPIRIGAEISPESDLGIAYNMGTDSGLKHSYLDTSVTNGRTYYYAVVSLDRGYDQDFYERGLAEQDNLITISPTECSATIQTDPLGRVIYTEVNTAEVVPQEAPGGWQEPELDEEGFVQTSGVGTGAIQLEIIEPYSVKPGTRYHLSFFDDSSRSSLGPLYTGKTTGAMLKNDTEDIVLYYHLGDDLTESLNDEVFDGFRLNFTNDELVECATPGSGWTTGSSTLFPEIVTTRSRGTPVPRDYEFRMAETGVDTSVLGYAANFTIWDVTDPDSMFQCDFYFRQSRDKADSLQGYLAHGDIIFVWHEAARKRLTCYEFLFPEELDSSMHVLPEAGDVFLSQSQKPFDRNDLFEFTLVGNAIEEREIKADLSKIYTVPDPYIAVSTLERRMVSEEVGRGDRRIDFVNLPPECTISIFTSSGRLVRELDHFTTENEGRESWDLRTRDGLEVTYGMYFYVVEAPGIGKKVGKLAIIK